MYKNQLQELAQRSCFNLPSYSCIKEGPNHAPRFKASVNFNGEIFESQTYCNTLRQAEHSAAEVAINVLSSRGPSRSLTARVLDETGIYKNLLQETAHRAGLRLPVYTTVRSGPGHVPTFTCSVEIAGMSFTGESAKTKKQAEKNAAIAAWSALNRMPATLELWTSSKADTKEDQVRKRDQIQIPSKRYFIGGPCGSSSSSSSSSSLSSSRLKLMNLIMDLGQEGFSQQKHNNFASLVPPPPPRTTSKILPPPPPPPPNRVQVIRSSHHANNTIVEHHVWDEEEWLGTTKKSSTGESSNTNTNTNTNSSGGHAYKAISSTHKPCHVFSKTYLHPHKIAPAVQIRSVIPVCSAPPPPPRPTTTTTIGSSTTSRPPNITQRFTLLGSEDGQQHINTA